MLVREVASVIDNPWKLSSYSTVVPPLVRGVKNLLSNVEESEPEFGRLGGVERVTRSRESIKTLETQIVVLGEMQAEADAEAEAKAAKEKKAADRKQKAAEKKANAAGPKTRSAKGRDLDDADREGTEAASGAEQHDVPTVDKSAPAVVSGKADVQQNASQATQTAGGAAVVPEGPAVGSSTAELIDDML
jgi:hypothetical protein